MHESTDLAPGPLHRFLADDHWRLDGFLAQAAARPDVIDRPKVRAATRRALPRTGFDKEAAQLFSDGDGL
jgi:hypothetical protein